MRSSRDPFVVSAADAAEAEGIRPDRVDFYTVREGDTWQSIAERSGGTISATTLAVMNLRRRRTRRRASARIQMVVGG